MGPGLPPSLKLRRPAPLPRRSLGEDGSPGRRDGWLLRKRSRLLTIFWHCGHWPFSSRTARRGSFGNEPSTVLVEDSALEGFGNADSQRKLRDFGWGGRCRPRARDLGCVPAHPPYWRASASYRPLRAVWAICAWALRGSREIEKTLQRPLSGARPKRNLQA
jgi:hypothetical protein